MNNSRSSRPKPSTQDAQGFNAAETRRLAKEFWEAQMNRVNHPMVPQEERPHIYKSPPQKGAWGKQKPNLPVPDFPFLSELQAALSRTEEAEKAGKSQHEPQKPRAA